MAKISTQRTGPSVPDEEDEESPLDVQGLIYALLRRFWLVALVAGLAGWAAWTYAQRLPTLYQSTAVIQVETQEQNAVQVRDGSQENLQNPEVVETIIQNFGSRSLMKRVSKTLGLATDARFLGYKSLQPASEDLVTALLLGGTRAALRPRTRLVDVSFVHPDRDVAYKVTNALVGQFIQQDVDQRMGTLETQNRILVEKSQELKEKVNRSEQALQNYKEKLATVSIEDRRNLVEEKLKALSGDLTNAKSERLRLESDANQIKLAKGQPEQLLGITSVAQDPQVVAAREKLTKEEENLTTLAQRYRAEHPRLIEQKAQVAAARGALTETVRAAPDRLDSRLTAARAREESLQPVVSEQEKALLEMDAKVIPYRALQREYDSDRTLFESVLQRLKESTLQLGVQAVSFHVAEPALAARQVPSKRPLLIVAAVLASGIFVSAIILLFAFLNRSISTVEFAERLLKLPVLAAIPPMKNAATPAETIAAMHRPESPEAEGFRTLRSALLLIANGSKQVVLVTSAVPAEGKSVTAGNIAAAFAHMGRKTVLVDADLRRPTLDGIFLPKDKESQGVGDYLTGGDIYIQPTAQENLHFISAGRRLQKPAESLSGPIFHDLIAQLQLDYDQIVIDTAPVNVVSDTLNIVSCASAICLVVRSNSTSAKVVKRAIELLRRSGVRPDGIILNWLSSRADHKYKEYYQGTAGYGNKETYGDLEVKPLASSTQRPLIYSVNRTILNRT